MTTAEARGTVAGSLHTRREGGSVLAGGRAPGAQLTRPGTNVLTRQGRRRGLIRTPACADVPGRRSRRRSALTKSPARDGDTSGPVTGGAGSDEYTF